jgi:hypothetical protein
MAAPDPAAFGLDVVGCGAGYMVVHCGRTVSGLYGSRDSALHRMHNIARRLAAAARPQRPCLCCGTTFASEGPHNRLCDPCRGLG